MWKILAVIGSAFAGIFAAKKIGAAQGTAQFPDPASDPRNAPAPVARESFRTTPSIDELFERYGVRYGVDPMLLKAIANVESSLNPSAVNDADRYSVGLMQILYRPSVTGNKNSPPANRFDIEGWSEATFERLKDPDFNIKMGAQILAWNIRTYGLPRGIAVYNAWDQRTAPQNGPFKNQTYVDKVLNYYRMYSAL